MHLPYNLLSSPNRRFINMKFVSVCFLFKWYLFFTLIKKTKTLILKVDYSHFSGYMEVRPIMGAALGDWSKYPNCMHWRLTVDDEYRLTLRATNPDGPEFSRVLVRSSNWFPDKLCAVTLIPLERDWYSTKLVKKKKSK